MDEFIDEIERLEEELSKAAADMLIDDIGYAVDTQHDLEMLWQQNLADADRLLSRLDCLDMGQELRAQLTEIVLDLRSRVARVESAARIKAYRLFALRNPPVVDL